MTDLVVQAIARHNQYRVYSDKMPNPEKEKRKQVLRSRIAESENARKPKVSEKDKAKKK